MKGSDRYCVNCRKETPTIKNGNVMRCADCGMLTTRKRWTSEELAYACKLLVETNPYIPVRSYLDGVAQVVYAGGKVTLVSVNKIKRWVELYIPWRDE